MEKAESLTSPGSCTAEIISQNEAEAEEWISIPTDSLETSQKDASHILLLAVEYVGQAAGEYSQSYPAFQQTHIATPHDYENCVSPLDPNLACTARYSPVYMTEENTSSNSFQDRAVSLPRSPSPEGSTTDQIHLASNIKHVNEMEETCSSESDIYITGLPSPSISSIAHSPTAPVCEHRNLIVVNESYFRDHSDAMGNYIVTSNGIICHSTSTFQNEVMVSIGSSNNKEPLSELMISPGCLQPSTQMTSAEGDHHFPLDIEHKTIVMPHDKGQKGEPVHLLISSEDLPSEVTRFITPDLLSSHESEHLDTVFESLKMQIFEKNAQKEPSASRNDLSPLNDNDISQHLEPLDSPPVTHAVMERHMLQTNTDVSTVESYIVPNNYSTLLKGYEDTSRSEEQEVGCETLRRSKRLAAHHVGHQFADHCCDDCDVLECPLHKVQTITDKPVPSRARASLPASYLAINKTDVLQNGDILYGVFARKTIPRRTQFGPVEGVLLETDKNVFNSEVDLLVETETGALRRLDVSDENVSNWMRFVRLTRNAKEQNLLLNQQGHSLYFTTTRVIHPRQELLVGYSSAYASKRGLPFYPSECKAGCEDSEQLWPCFECSEKFTSSEDLQKHLNVHDAEKGDKVASKSAPTTSNRYRRKGAYHVITRKSILGLDKSVKKFSYLCTVCYRAFPRSYSLKRHQLLHTTPRKYQCEHCDLQFTHVYNKNRHIKASHKVELPKAKAPSYSSTFKKRPTENNNSSVQEWSCTHCSLTFDNSSVLNLHTLAHAAENVEIITGLPSDFSNVYHAGEFLVENGDIQCPQCTEEFSTKKELINHVSQHAKHYEHIISKPWKCELCYKSFATEERVKQHLLVHGSEDQKPLQCNTCQKRFLNNSALVCHLKTHTDNKMFECPICKEAFDQVMELKEHAYGHSKNGTFTCPHCKKIFEEYSQIRKHIRAFHCERKHKCAYCQKRFPSLDKLRMHMLKHSDHREFLCANCGKQFKRKDKLKEHTKRMHSAEKEETIASKSSRSPGSKKFNTKGAGSDYHRFIFKCHPCQVGFKRRGMLVNHLANRHPDISPMSVPELNLPILKATRDYYCQYCDKIYKSSSKRKAHILKNHPGAELPLSNRRKGGLPEIPGIPNPTFSHTVGSVTTNPHSCTWCHKQYASKAKLLQHQRKKHPDNLPEMQQVPKVPRQPSSPEGGKHKVKSPRQKGGPLPPPLQSPPTNNTIPVQLQLQSLDLANSIAGDYITASEDDLQHFQDPGIVIDTSAYKHGIKDIDGVPVDLLSQAVSELSGGDFQLTLGPDHYFKIVASAQTFTPYPPR